MPMIYLKGIFYTKNGQCLECKPVILVKLIENKQYDRLAILFNMRRDWQSYRFQEIDEKHLPLNIGLRNNTVEETSSPKRRGKEPKRREKDIQPVQKKTNTKVETRLSPEENESITWLKPGTLT